MSDIIEQLHQRHETDPEMFPESPAGKWGQTAQATEAALDGVVMFYRTEPIRTGRRNIDWSGSHRKHQEWPAQLNRFMMLYPLCAGYRNTKDEKYARAARDYIEDWLDMHEPYPAQPDLPRPAPGDSTLNMAVRLGSTQHPGWLMTLVDLGDSDAFDEPFVERIASSIVWQLDWLAQNLPAGANWRIAALDCLFSQAFRLPERFGKHLSSAVEGLNTEFATQILPDGAHLERSAGYNDWMCRVFVALWRLGRRRPELGLRLDDERIVRMHSYTLHHTRPNGTACRFNDASGPLRTRPDAARGIAGVYDEHQGLRREAHLDGEVPHVGFFRSAGHVFYRTGWGADDLWWAFDAGAWGGGHSHLSRLSIELHNGRRTTLPDPGIFDYEMSNPLGPAGKSTAAHSTMNIELHNQAQADARLVRAEDLGGAVVVQGQYAGSYWPGTFGWRFLEGHARGLFGIHDRIVVWLKDRAMVVLDGMSHDAGRRVFLHWLSDDVPVDLDTRCKRLTTADAEGNVRIQVCPISPKRATVKLRRGEKDPYLGWVSESHDPKPAPLMQCSFKAPGERGQPVRTECATVIAPFFGPDAPQFTAQARTDGMFAREVRIAWSDGAQDRVIYVFNPEAPIRRMGDVRTDGGVVVIRRSPEGVQTVDALGATWLKIADEDVPL